MVAAEVQHATFEHEGSTGRKRVDSAPQQQRTRGDRGAPRVGVPGAQRQHTLTLQTEPTRALNLPQKLHRRGSGNSQYAAAEQEAPALGQHAEPRVAPRLIAGKRHRGREAQASGPHLKRDPEGAHVQRETVIEQTCWSRGFTNDSSHMRIGSQTHPAEV